jgi:hypothetical protein
VIFPYPDTAMLILESFVASSADALSLGGDRLFVSDDFLAVIDGETPKGPAKAQQPDSTAAQIICDSLASAPASISPYELIEKISLDIRSAPEWDLNLAAVAAIWMRASSCVVRVGNVWVGIDDKVLKPTKLIDDIAAQARALALSALLAKGATPTELRESDPGRELILPLMRMAQAFRNVPDSRYGFGILDGSLVPAEFIEIIPIHKTAEVVFLASDGYDSPTGSLTESNAEMERSCLADPLRIGIEGAASTKAVRTGAVTADDRAFLSFRPFH